ncbi:hypothetical protein BDZ88DRAFT_441550 [Geranomyces variabilis]|nr:hypothetical protein BDZ88DRAFT_441550 [Geranomyces variabilis]
MKAMTVRNLARQSHRSETIIAINSNNIVTFIVNENISTKWKCGAQLCFICHVRDIYGETQNTETQDFVKAFNGYCREGNCKFTHKLKMKRNSRAVDKAKASWDKGERPHERFVGEPCSYRRRDLKEIESQACSAQSAAVRGAFGRHATEPGANSFEAVKREPRGRTVMALKSQQQPHGQKRAAWQGYGRGLFAVTRHAAGDSGTRGRRRGPGGQGKQNTLIGESHILVQPLMTTSSMRADGVQELAVSDGGVCGGGQTAGGSIETQAADGCKRMGGRDSRVNSASCDARVTVDANKGTVASAVAGRVPGSKDEEASEETAGNKLNERSVEASQSS